jgi:hypothetical protein
VATLERLALRRDQPTVRQLARIALTNLGVNVNEPQPSPQPSSQSTFEFLACVRVCATDRALGATHRSGR